MISFFKAQSLLTKNIWCSIFFISCSYSTHSVLYSEKKYSDFISALENPADNVLPITINGSSCSSLISASLINQPCVSLVICASGSETECETIPDVLVDTHTTGLRLFESALSGTLVSHLTFLKKEEDDLRECYSLQDGSFLWGSVVIGSLILGHEKPIQVPFHLLKPDPYGWCPGAYVSPAAAGFNGILGVGSLAQDCGQKCVEDETNNQYFACHTADAHCQNTSVEKEDQVNHPVFLLPIDRNGVIIQFPSLATEGKETLTGALILGIGTQTNNIPQGVHSFPLHENLFQTGLSGKIYDTVINTRTKGIFFPSDFQGITPCSSLTEPLHWFCPDTLQTAAAYHPLLSPYGWYVIFSLENYEFLLNRSGKVFSHVGGSRMNSLLFEWGLPFFFGREVIIGIEQEPSLLGRGPYIAY